MTLDHPVLDLIPDLAPRVRPKGAMLSHRNVQVQALTCIRAMDMGDGSERRLPHGPVLPHRRRVPTVIHPLGAFDPEEMLDAYEREGATIVFNVPSSGSCVLRGEDSLPGLGSVGRPIPTIQYRVVDAEMNHVPVGDVGKIVYRGPTVMKGYWNAPEATGRERDRGAPVGR